MEGTSAPLDDKNKVYDESPIHLEYEKGYETINDSPTIFHPITSKDHQEEPPSTSEIWSLRPIFIASFTLVFISVLQTVIQFMDCPVLLLALEPMCLNLCLFSPVLLGVLYLIFGAFVMVLGKSRIQSMAGGFDILGPLVGIAVAIFTDPLWHRNYMRLVRERERNGGEKGGAESEFRLPPAVAGGILTDRALLLSVRSVVAGLSSMNAVPCKARMQCTPDIVTHTKRLGWMLRNAFGVP